METKKIQELINNTFGLIAAMRATGDDQERAALAKENLRQAYALTEAAKADSVTTKEGSGDAAEAAENEPT